MTKRVRLDKYNYILGVDPGLTGALAFYCPSKNLIIKDVPTLDATRGRQIDLYQAVRDLDELANQHFIQHAFIEQVHSMPNQGISGAFKFGTTYGVLQGVVAAVGIPMTLVPPQKWKKSLSVPKNKDAARYRASQLLPDYAHMWDRKKDDGRAEAALIAYYGSTQLMG